MDIFKELFLTFIDYAASQLIEKTINRPVDNGNINQLGPLDEIKGCAAVTRILSLAVAFVKTEIWILMSSPESPNLI